MGPIPVLLRTKHLSYSIFYFLQLRVLFCLDAVREYTGRTGVSQHIWSAQCATGCLITHQGPIFG